MSRDHWTKAFSNSERKSKAFGTDTPVAKKLRTALKPLEDDEQKVVIQWASVTKFEGLSLAGYLHHSPNGGKREVKKNAAGQTYCPEGIRLKEMGTLAGFPDLTLFIARGGYFGLYIEMKVNGGATSPEQKAIHARMIKQGYCVLVCYGSLETMNAIKDYLAKPATVTTVGVAS